ncbi:Cas10/Cmr2 second palm domain-containing protein [Oryzibacter oryziterrae]|uniref:Cas10/Cmr2 second palm domain-containing protein n=1 Tax=Oryzibacter oryziterrae TaxID=2766474 RepID=UPI001F248542|nr:type III-B CRISPR-associated protein Cas10/Cmr2 [Oryzibacter oryziterrae]
MAEFVLHFHLGPVQAFISEARRTRDIWAGSFILSWLSAEALAAALDGAPATRVLSPKLPDNDPTFMAVRRKRGEAPVGGTPFLGTFPNHFSVEVNDLDAGQRAARKVRACWVALAQAVEALIFDTKIDDSTLGEVDEAARALFRHQIGTIDHTPMWEIYTVIVAKGEWDDTGPSPLAVRKLQRWCADSAAMPDVQLGALCSMLPGWQEISGVDDVTNRDKGKIRDAFWTAVRAAVVAARYGEHRAVRENAIECLDLVPKERLSAPALVKRLFPLLADGTLEGIFGWVPVVRSSSVLAIYDEKTPSDVRTKLLKWFSSWLWRRGEEAPVLKSISVEQVEAQEGRQSFVLWPSTSYVAAAHWIERVHKYAPKQGAAVAKAIQACGRHLAVAERTLFIGSTLDGESCPLAPVDGASLFPNTVERMIRDAEHQAPFKALSKALEMLAAVPLDSANPNGPKIGRPAPVYAIIVADGDKMGERLASKPDLSKGLSHFTQALRGGLDHDVGAIAKNNGVTLYASADEMIAMCPIEDALQLALDVRNSFLEATKAFDPQATISVAITFAHRQVPLSWVLNSAKSLLDGTAKDALGGNALAIEIIDAGGRRADWASFWQVALIPGMYQALDLILRAALNDAPQLGSNQFLHEFATCLEPLLFDDDTVPAAARAGMFRRRDVFQSGDLPPDLYRMTSEEPFNLASRLTNALIAKHCLSMSPSRREELTEALIKISGIDYPGETAQAHSSLRLTPSGIKILRFLVENWRAPALDLE